MQNADYDISERTKEIQKLIMINEMDGALSRLFDFVNDFDEMGKWMDEVIIIFNNHTDLEDTFIEGTITREERMVSRNRIIKRILGILSKLKRMQNLGMAA